MAQVKPSYEPKFINSPQTQSDSTEKKNQADDNFIESRGSERVTQATKIASVFDVANILLQITSQSYAEKNSQIESYPPNYLSHYPRLVTFIFQAAINAGLFAGISRASGYPSSIFIVVQCILAMSILMILCFYVFIRNLPMRSKEEFIFTLSCISIIVATLILAVHFPIANDGLHLNDLYLMEGFSCICCIYPTLLHSVLKSCRWNLVLSISLISYIIAGIPYILFAALDESSYQMRRRHDHGVYLYAVVVAYSALAIYSQRYERLENGLSAKNSNAYQHNSSVSINHSLVVSNRSVSSRQGQSDFKDDFISMRSYFLATIQDTQMLLMSLLSSTEMVSGSLTGLLITCKGSDLLANITMLVSNSLEDTLLKLKTLKRAEEFILDSLTRAREASLASSPSASPASSTYYPPPLHATTSSPSLSVAFSIQPRIECLEIRETIHEIVEMLSNAGMSNANQIKVLSLPESICSVILSDKHFIQENLLCLLVNAKKNSIGDAEITVRVSLRSSQDLERDVSRKSGSGASEKHLVLEVQDTGEMYPEAARAGLFYPVPIEETAKSSYLKLNRGISLYGLACKTAALGGSFGVSKRQDGQKGASLWFSIPYKPETLALMNHRSSLPNEANASDASLSFATRKSSEPSVMSMGGLTHVSSNSQPSILLVDDSVFNLKLTTRQLKDAGFEVFQATNGLEALTLMQSHGNFDLILMDLHMPIMDGLETIRRIRRQEASGRRFGLLDNDSDSNYSSDKGDEDDESVEPAAGGKKKTQPAATKAHQLIIACSGNGDDSTVQETFIEGADQFLIKPFNIQHFLDVFNALKHDLARTRQRTASA